MRQSRATRPELLSGQFRKTSSALRILRRVVDHCQQLIFLTDAAGVLRYVNPACETVTGYRTDELTGKNLDWIAPAAPQTESWNSMREQALQRGAFRGVTGLRSKHGSVVEVDIAVTVVRDPRTQAASLAWTGTVIAQQHDIKPEMDSSQKMESLGVFAGGIAHDFNNLLMVIGAYAEIGLIAIPTEHPSCRHMQEILAAVRRASELTRRLLAFGRNQVSGQQLVSLNWIVEDAVGMLSRLLEEDIEVRVSLDKDAALVRVNPGQMEQLLLNLVVNARDAMPDGGELVIATQSVTLDSEFAGQHSGIAAGEHVLLTVTDSGHGMRAEELARIFDPFYTTKPEGKGTGLGLAIVQSVVRENGGVISADSEPGVGTSFKIYLPIAIAAARLDRPSGSSVQEPAMPRGNEALLVVEDLEPLRQSIVEFLCSLGYKTQSAPNGEEALRTVQNDGHIALMITDVVIPRMSGPDLARSIATMRLPTKILFISGHAQDTVRNKGVKVEEHNFLQKPFSLTSLALKIREVLDQPAAARAAAAGASTSSSSSSVVPSAR